MNSRFEKHYLLADRLMDLEMVLRECGAWECEPPSEEALASVTPFCIDTMSFAQWLRFVMMARFKQMLEEGATLPTRCHISPMAADAFSTYPAHHVANIVAALDRIDAHLNGKSQ
ncbi:YqcC family protein [Marinomonas arenicola]|uniref:YqcC family protein n=1 Tax=Marinomonas arenicola TaxID=569601 RepID=UPI00311FF44A